MKRSELVAGTAYAVKKGTASYYDADCGVLLDTASYALWVDRYGNRPTELRPAPKQVSTSSRLSGVVVWGLPVARILRPEQVNRFIQLDPQLDLTVRGAQTIKGIKFEIGFYRPQSFVSSWADELVRQRGRDEARIASEKKQIVDEAHRREIAPRLKRLMGGVRYSFNEYNDRVTVFSADELIALLEGLSSGHPQALD